MSTLLRLIGRRLVALPVMVLGVTLLVFVVMSFSPSDPARLALGEAASAQALEQYRIAHHLNDPLLVRYWNYLVGLAHGSLGVGPLVLQGSGGLQLKTPALVRRIGDGLAAGRPT